MGQHTAIRRPQGVNIVRFLTCTSLLLSSIQTAAAFSGPTWKHQVQTKTTPRSSTSAIARNAALAGSRRHHAASPIPLHQSTSNNNPDTTTNSSPIADVEEITTFANNNGVTLSFTTFGPGYRGIAVAKNDPEKILGYIEGFLRPGGKILHADKMEIFKSALNSARSEGGFRGGGTFLGPGLLIAMVCLLHGKENGCQRCEFLAIDDAEFQHKRLVRYYKTAGFDEVRYVGEELKDIPDRLVWGGCGTLMTEEIDKILIKWTRIIRGSTD